jgi:hypothetical protein
MPICSCLTELLFGFAFPRNFMGSLEKGKKKKKPKKHGVPFFRWGHFEPRGQFAWFLLAEE